MKRDKPYTPTLSERISVAIGSPISLVLHTFIFAGFFGSVIAGILELETMLLILTTIVSLEAIYLAIFIQMSVNANTRSLREVEEDIEEIQEDVEEISEDVGEIQEDIEEIEEEIEELSEEDAEDERREQQQAVSLEQLTEHVRRILDDLETLKKSK